MTAADLADLSGVFGFSATVVMLAMALAAQCRERAGSSDLTPVYRREE